MLRANPSRTRLLTRLISSLFATGALPTGRLLPPPRPKLKTPKQAPKPLAVAAVNEKEQERPLQSVIDGATVQAVVRQRHHHYRLSHQQQQLLQHVWWVKNLPAFQINWTL